MTNGAIAEDLISGPPDGSFHEVDNGVEYTAAFQDLDAAINAFDSEGLGPLRKGERPFQWDSVVNAAEDLLAQSPDLRVSIWLLRALLEQQGVSGFAQGLARISDLLALPQDSLFPRASDGEPAREAHAVSLAWLGSTAVLHQVRTAKIASSVTLACADLHQDATLALALEPSVKTTLAAAIQNGLQALDSIILALQQDASYLPFDVTPLHDELAYVGRVLGQNGEPSEATTTSSVHPESTVQGFSKGLGLRTRADVQQTLSAVIAYFKEHEPGHPAPLLLQRVQRMLGASFEELMSELYADAKQMIARIEKPQAL